jgi:MFS family permease
MSSAPGFSLRQIAIPAFGPSLLFGLGEGAVLPIIPLTARELGASPATSALIVTLIGVGSLVSNLPASIITMRVGERWALVSAGLAAAGALALLAFGHAIWALGIGTLLLGMAQAVFGLARQTYHTEVVPVEIRARALSTLGGAMRVGLFAGPFLGAAAIAVAGLDAAYAVGIAALLLAAALSGLVPDLRVQGPRNDASRAEPVSFAGIVREHRLVFAGLGLGVMALSAVRAARPAVIPLWADHLGIDASTTAVIYGISAAVDMLLFYPAGKLMDARGRAWVAVPSMLIMGLALIALPLSQGTASLLVLAVLVGLGNGISSGLIMTLGADHAPRNGRAHFLGAWRLMADSGAACGPGVVSLLATVSLASGVVAVGVLGLFGAWQLGRWIPRLGDVGSTRGD